MCFFKMQSGRVAARLVIATLGVASLTGCAGKSASPAAPTGSAAELYAAGARSLDNGKIPEAITSLQAATMADPKMIMAHARLGDAYKESDDFKKAAAEYEIVTQLDPNDSASWYKLGASRHLVGSSRVDLQACKLEYSIVSPK